MLALAASAAVIFMLGSPSQEVTRINVNSNGVVNDDSVSVVFGWKWNEPVDVYSAVSGGNWKVAEAVAEWDIKSGAIVRMTTDINSANIVIQEGTASDCQTTSPTVAGCAYLPARNGGVASGKTNVYLMSAYRSFPAAEHIAIHELGHTLGLNHTSFSKSVMRTSVSNSNYFKTPQVYDYKDMKALYGR